jgi:hypothetical protein
VIGWLKDADGRYLYVNRPYVEQLGTTEERLLGRTDAELPPDEVVDGPRIRGGARDGEGPIDLEYRVAAFESRPELAVMRFAVRDEAGAIVGLCGVAGAVVDAELVTSECHDLLRMLHGEREEADPAFSGAAVSYEPTAASDEPAAVPEPTGAPGSELLAELTAERANGERLRRELDLALARIGQLEQDLHSRAPVAVGPAGAGAVAANRHAPHAGVFARTATPQAAAMGAPVPTIA